MDLGLLLSIPLESVTVRVIVATVAAVVLVRLLLRVGLRSPHARVATAIAPAVALVAVVLVTGTAVRLPTLMVPAEGVQALPIPVRDGYLHFAPMALPLLVGLWAVIAGYRLVRRTFALAQVRREAERWVEQGVPARRVENIATRTAAALHVAAPRIALRPTCPGGAYVVGSRRPIVVLGEDLLRRLDDEELEGVLAHELAHVRRRDTLVATLLGMLRDLAFFVPGVGWTVRQLHRERELAADQIAVRVTHRPGALASGLLKVVEDGPSPAPCAALVPSGGLVDRVNVLVEDRPAPTRARRSGETVAVGVVVLAAVVAALTVPGTLAGADREREAVALVWSATRSAVAGDLPDGEARVFDVYRRSRLEVGAPQVTATTWVDEASHENRRSALRACAMADCPSQSRSLGLGLQPAATTSGTLSPERWEPRPVGNQESVDGLRLFWLQRGERITE